MSPGLRAIPKLGKLGPKSPAGVVPKAPPPGKTQGRPLPTIPLVTLAPQGPEGLKLGENRRVGTGGPGMAPQEWEGPETEWVWHWASRKLFFQQEKLDPYQTPWGGLTWQFQAPENPLNPREAGGSVSDFIYIQAGGNVIVRIEGYYDHYVRGGAAQQARDLFLIAQAGGTADRVVRINDGDFMTDPSGNLAIRLLADVLAGGNPGTDILRAPRYANFELGTV